MDYISREAVIKELDTMYDNMISMGARFYKGFMLARHTVNDFPAADVREVEVYEASNYCPNCGAMMGGQDNG